MATPPQASRKGKWWSETKPDVKWATALLLVLVLVSPIVGYYVGFVDAAPFGYAGWEATTAGEEDLAAVTQLIFATDGLVAPFEILSVLLLAALIAGIVLAYRDPEGPE